MAGGIRHFKEKHEDPFPSLGFIDITLSKAALSQLQDYGHLLQKLSNRKLGNTKIRKPMKNLLHQTDSNSLWTLTGKDINSSIAMTESNNNLRTFGMNPLDKLLIQKNAVYQILKFFKGLFYVGVVCYDPVTTKEEIYDYSDVVSPPSNLCEGTEIEIKNVKSSVEFKRIINGTFYKWQTTTGENFILNQAEVDTLTKKEKRYLRIY